MAQFLAYSWATMGGTDERVDEKVSDSNMVKLDAALDLYFDDGAINVSSKVAKVAQPKKTTKKLANTPRLYTQAELDALTQEAVEKASPPTSAGSQPGMPWHM